ncbi:MAG: alpha/beta hydrolase family protein [Solirubrobacteraceae bacterium]
MAHPSRAVCQLLAATLAFAACGGTDREPAPSGFGRGTEVSYATSDGVKISATLRLPPGRAPRPIPAVVLVHQLGGDRHDFNALLPALGRAGYATLAYDIRGTGRSNGMVDGTVFRPGTDRAAYVAMMPRDVTAALRYLRGRPDIDGERIAVVGSSWGANVAIAASRLPGGPAATVAVSPIADTIARSVQRRGRPRGVLLIADRAELGSAWELARGFGRPGRVALAQREGHGVMLLPDRAVRAEILDWLARLMDGERTAVR